MTVHLYGKRIGRLQVLHPTSKRIGGSIVWKCTCDCGALNVELSARDLLNGNRRGCGACEDTKHPLYPTWRGMIARCDNEELTEYKHYGGRGITVCDRWKESFLYFIADMGPKPRPSYSIDRIDVNGNYTPENCRWASKVVQANNKQDIVWGLTDAQIVEIYYSKNFVEKIASDFGCSEKTVRNIKAKSYSERATKVVMAEFMRRIGLRT